MKNYKICEHGYIEINPSPYSCTWYSPTLNVILQYAGIYAKEYKRELKEILEKCE